MAKKSKIVREKKLLKNIQKYAKKRADLKAIINSPNTKVEDRDIAVHKLDRLPKSSSPIRLRIGVLLLVGQEALLGVLSYLDYHFVKWRLAVKFQV